MSNAHVSVVRMFRPAQGSARKPTNLTLPESLVLEAKALSVNVSQACERGLAVEVSKARAQRWLQDNAAAIGAWNDYIEEHGIPLAEYRQF